MTDSDIQQVKTMIKETQARIADIDKSIGAHEREVGFLCHQHHIETQFLRELIEDLDFYDQPTTKETTS